MREIKFRAWDEDEGVMLKPFKVYEVVSTPMLILEKDILLQYTGLKDKNGKEIYEGDILKTAVGIGYVRENHGMFCLKKPGLNALKPFMRRVNHPLEVIGNIYEDPELLK